MLTGMPFALAGGCSTSSSAARPRSSPLGAPAQRRPRRPPAAARAPRPRGRVPLVLLPDDLGDAQALHRGARRRPRRRGPAPPRPAPATSWVAAIAVPLGFTRGVAPALGVRRPHPPRRPLARGPRGRRRARSPDSGPRPSSCSGLLGLSAVAWPVVAGLVTGVPTAFFDVQAAWGQRPDKGPFVLWFEWAWQGKGVARGPRPRRPRRHLHRARPRPARTVDLPSRPAPGPSPTRSTSSPSCAPSRACGASSSSTSRSPRSSPRWRCAPPTDSRSSRTGGGGSRSSSSSLVGGILWWTCALLVYTPWGSFPRDREAADFVSAARLRDNGRLLRRSGAGTHAAPHNVTATKKGFQPWRQ